MDFNSLNNFPSAPHQFIFIFTYNHRNTIEREINIRYYKILTPNTVIYLYNQSLLYDPKFS